MMFPDSHSSIRTRPSLLNRLKTGDDTQSWQEFYRVYGKLVRDFAIKVGLTDTEADEVVQETSIAVARNLPEFRYDPKVCRFKTWLLNQTSWRVKDQLRKRTKAQLTSSFSESDLAHDQHPNSTHTPGIDSVPDPAPTDLDALFETEWRQSLFAAALERVKGQFSLKQFQIFDLVVSKEWPTADVARSLGVSMANVYVIRHRISAALKREMKRLESTL